MKGCVDKTKITVAIWCLLNFFIAIRTEIESFMLINSFLFIFIVVFSG